jgi:CHASE2 domain-containing sensor protein
LTIVCGLALWTLPLGEKWADASYDCLFRFGTHSVTNKVVIVFMDNEAYAKSGQTREKPWDRSLHVQLLNKLADDGCPLVVFDIFFREAGDSGVDDAMAGAMRRLGNVVVAAEQADIAHPDFDAAKPTLPVDKILIAAQTNWGVAWLDPDLDMIVRRHWPFPNPGPYPSLPWIAAQLAGSRLSEVPAERWLRYYGVSRVWTSLSYQLALEKGPNYFRDKIVFIGTKPRTSFPDGEPDEFQTPYTRRNGETVGGVEILTTSFLNLINADWLRRMAWPVEGLLFLMAGGLLGGALCLGSRPMAFGLAMGATLATVVATVCLSYLTNFWFPWLIVAGAQVPCALVWAMIPAKTHVERTPPGKTIVLRFPDEKLPDAPEYELFNPPIGQGGFGKVWIARNAIGQWQALKAVYQSKFGDNTRPYEAEFHGIQKYKPVSEKHPGLLRIDLVSKMKSEGYFYYVMELGDAQSSGWEQQPSSYKPRDLENVRRQANNRRLSVAECLHIGTVLAEALEFLHGQGLTHRDIKPSNVIFVNGRPKLADVGLVTDIRPPEQENTMVGTLGYMPPPPESPGTAQADIYALGMLLYVISTGRDPDRFPDVAATLMESSGHAEFIRFNALVLKACQPDTAQRYQTMAEMLRALQEAGRALTHG